MLESSVGTERDCCKIVILGIKQREYLSYHHLIKSENVAPGGEQFLKRGCSEAIVKVVVIVVVLFVFFKIFVIVDRGEGAGLCGLGLKGRCL